MRGQVQARAAPVESPSAPRDPVRRGPLLFPARGRTDIFNGPQHGGPRGGRVADILLDTPARFYPLRLAEEKNSSVRVSRRAVSRTQGYLRSRPSSHTPASRCAFVRPPFGIGDVWCGPRHRQDPVAQGASILRGGRGSFADGPSPASQRASFGLEVTGCPDRRRVQTQERGLMPHCGNTQDGFKLDDFTLCFTP